MVTHLSFVVDIGAAARCSRGCLSWWASVSPGIALTGGRRNDGGDEATAFWY